MHSLVHSLLSILILFNLLGCASMPQTADEFRAAVTPSSMWVSKTEFDLQGVKLSELKSRVEKYSNKCLKDKETYSQESSTNRMGTMTVYGTSSVSKHYHSTVTSTPSRVTLTLQMKTSSDGSIIGKVPEKGSWRMLADMDLVSGGAVHVTIHVPLVFAGKLAENTAGWIKDDKKLCPELN